MNQLCMRPNLFQEIKRFGEQWELTPREKDVLHLVALGTTRIKDVATRLNLSPNTVNNHISSIFVKSQTSSKSELLTRLLLSLIDELCRYRIFRQTPRVAILAEEASVSALRGVLESQGCRVRIFSETAAALEFMSSEFTHFFVIDCNKKNVDVDQLLRRLVELPLTWTKALVTGDAESDQLAKWLDAGAVGFHARADLPERIFARLVCHFTENLESALQFEEPLLAQLPKGKAVVELNPHNVGRGGVFLPREVLHRTLPVTIGVGDRIDLEFRGREVSSSGTHHPEVIEAAGEIVWLREVDNNSLRAGAGIRTIALKSECRDYLAQFHSANGIRSYIPLGVVPKTGEI